MGQQCSCPDWSMSSGPDGSVLVLSRVCPSSDIKNSNLGLPPLGSLDTGLRSSGHFSNCVVLRVLANVVLVFHVGHFGDYVLVLLYLLVTFDNCIVLIAFLPWEIQVAFPGKSQLRQSRATQPTVHAGCFVFQ